MHIYIKQRRERGIAAIEFALIASVFFSLLFGMMEMSRLFFYWNTATEATRMGARMAVVCTMDDANIKARMTSLFPVIGQDEIRIDYLPAGCSATTCEQVTVRIESTKSIETYIPFIPLAVTLPPFLTTLPRESMASANNPACS